MDSIFLIVLIVIALAILVLSIRASSIYDWIAKPRLSKLSKPVLPVRGAPAPPVRRQAPGPAPTSTAQRRQAPLAPPALLAEQKAYQTLLTMTHGDRAMVERLIKAEARRTPGECRGKLIEQAIWRWQRDNR